MNPRSPFYYQHTAAELATRERRRERRARAGLLETLLIAAVLGLLIGAACALLEYAIRLIFL